MEPVAPSAWLLLALVFVLTSCGSSPSPIPAVVPQASPHRAPWTYAGPTGPWHWGDLDPSYAACSQGTKQSPIDLPLQNSAASAVVLPHYNPVPLTIGNNGHTVQVDDAAPSSLVVDGVSYSLSQFHFHLPSEHTIDGRTFDAELHLVHRAPNGNLAVIALFFNRGVQSGVLRPLFDAIPMDPGPPRSVARERIDLEALMPRAPRFLSYEGSLTTPPCTEGVRWLVVLPDPAPLELAESDLDKLRAAVHAPNNRPLQPSNGRLVELRAPQPP